MPARRRQLMAGQVAADDLVAEAFLGGDVGQGLLEAGFCLVPVFQMQVDIPLLLPGVPAFPGQDEIGEGQVQQGERSFADLGPVTQVGMLVHLLVSGPRVIIIRHHVQFLGWIRVIEGVLKPVLTDDIVFFGIQADLIEQVGWPDDPGCLTGHPVHHAQVELVQDIQAGIGVGLL